MPSALGIPYVVMHPGAYTTSSEEAGLATVVRAFDEVHRQTPGLKVVTLIETTAGQGSCLGWKFEHLAEIIPAVPIPSDWVCVDTCHIFAAGYALGTPKEYKATIKQLSDIVGLDRVKAFHLNDSKQGLGSRVDRHEDCGTGPRTVSHVARRRAFRQSAHVSRNGQRTRKR